MNTGCIMKNILLLLFLGVYVSPSLYTQCDLIKNESSDGSSYLMSNEYIIEHNSVKLEMKFVQTESSSAILFYSTALDLAKCDLVLNLFDTKTKSYLPNYSPDGSSYNFSNLDFTKDSANINAILKAKIIDISFYCEGVGDEYFTFKITKTDEKYFKSQIKCLRDAKKKK